jgi:hypothetical protein
MMLVGAIVSGFWNTRLPALLSAGSVEKVRPSFVGGVNAEGNALIGGDKDWIENGVKGVGVIRSGWEGFSGL